jgi:hypothetical protein
MNKKERALHHLESEMDSIAQSIYCSKKCSLCPYLRRIHAMQGKVRILMDYGDAPKNTTLTTFQIKKWGAGKRRATYSNQRVKKQPEQKEIGEEIK